jgi:hypothetical protein
VTGLYKVDSHAVRYDKEYLACDCVEFFKSHQAWFGRTQTTAGTPWCEHIEHMLSAYGDTLPNLHWISVHVTRKPHLSMNVQLKSEDVPGEVTCCILVPGKTANLSLMVWESEIFLGYLPTSSSRQDIAALIWPVLTEEYFMRCCPECANTTRLKRSDLKDPKLQREAVFYAGYLIKFDKCFECNNYDLIPNASSDPVKIPGWPLDMGIGKKKKRTKPPSWTAESWALGL